MCACVFAAMVAGGGEFLCSVSMAWLEPFVFAVSGAVCLCSELNREQLNGSANGKRRVCRSPVWFSSVRITATL